MRRRACFIWKENDQVTIYTSGRDTLQILAQGHAFCKAFFPSFLEDKKWRIPSIRDEGGLLIDNDKKYVLIYGGIEYISWTPCLQRLYIKRLQKKWPGWDVKWATQGMADIVIYLDLLTNEHLKILKDEVAEEFLRFKEPIPWKSSWTLPYSKDIEQNNVITIKSNGTIKHYKLDYGTDGIDFILFRGEAVGYLFPNNSLIQVWQNEAVTTETLLIDYDCKKIYVCWGIARSDQYIKAYKEIWPGWEIIRQSEGLPFHFAYTDSDPSVIIMTEEAFEKAEGRLFGPIILDFWRFISLEDLINITDHLDTTSTVYYRVVTDFPLPYNYIVTNIADDVDKGFAYLITILQLKEVINTLSIQQNQPLTIEEKIEAINYFIERNNDI